MTDLRARLSNRITLQRRTLVETSSGETIETWEDAGELRASVEPLKGKEFFGTRSDRDMPQISASIDARIRIRYRQGISPAEHRIVHGGIIYDLTAVIHDRRQKPRQTQLMVTAASTQQTDGSGVNA